MDRCIDSSVTACILYKYIFFNGGTQDRQTKYGIGDLPAIISFPSNYMAYLKSQTNQNYRYVSHFKD